MKSIFHNHLHFSEWKTENGLYHREEGPAYEDVDGFKSWWYEGKRHRMNGPAVINPKDGIVEMTWYYYGEKIACSSQEEFERLIKLKVLW